MDATQLQEIANTNFDFKSYKQTLKEKIEAQLVVTHNGGMFKATPELIAFVYILKQSSSNSDVYLTDLYENPIKANSEELYTKLIEAHQYALNAWHIEFEESKKIRKINV